MSDLTKEELQIILRSLESDGDYSTATCDYEMLMEKIHSLIDNYCEHESKIDIGEAPMICQKCGKVTG